MKPLTLHCRFLSPAWLAGADQSRAELRVPSIRGELRWWFRVLGGTAAQEREVFGGVHGQAVASRVRLRITDAQPVHMREQDFPRMSINTPLAWLWHFAKAGDNKALRFSTTGCLSPDTSFDLEIRYREQLTPDCAALWETTLVAFACLGSLGFRANRAAGAVSATCEALPVPNTVESLREWVAGQPGLRVFLLHNDRGDVVTCTNWREACHCCESLLRGLREDFKAGKGGDQESPLGSATPRQGSAASLRPILLDSNLIPALIYTPQVLSPGSMDPAFDACLPGFRFAHPFRKDAAPTHALSPLV